MAGTSCKRAGFKNKAEESDATLHRFLFARLSIVFEMFGCGKYEGYLCRLFSIQARTLHLAVLRGGDQERHECARSQSLRMAACADIPLPYVTHSRLKNDFLSDRYKPPLTFSIPRRVCFASSQRTLHLAVVRGDPKWHVYACSQSLTMAACADIRCRTILTSVGKSFSRRIETHDEYVAQYVVYSHQFLNPALLYSSSHTL